MSATSITRICSQSWKRAGELAQHCVSFDAIAAWNFWRGDRHGYASAGIEERCTREHSGISRDSCAWDAAGIFAYDSVGNRTGHARGADHQCDLPAWTVHCRDDTADCRRVAILRDRSRFLCGFESADTCVLCGRQTQYANGGKLFRHRRESFSQLAFHLPAELGTSWPCLFDKPGRDNQFSFALRLDAPAYTQARDTPDLSWSRKDLSCRRSSGAGLLAGQLLVAGCVGESALFSAVSHTAHRDCIGGNDVFRSRLLAAGKRGAGHHRCFPATISLTPAFKPVIHEQPSKSRLNGLLHCSRRHRPEGRC